MLEAYVGYLFVNNRTLYGAVPKISTTLREQRLTFAGHIWRGNETAKHCYDGSQRTDRDLEEDKLYTATPRRHKPLKDCNMENRDILEDSHPEKRSFEQARPDDVGYATL